MDDNAKVRKSVSEDRTYIDYTRKNFGVRIWNDKAQAIALSGSEWLGREGSKSLPIDDSFRNLPVAGGMQPVPALALEIASVGSAELKKLASGEMSFKEALDTSSPLA